MPTRQSESPASGAAAPFQAAGGTLAARMQGPGGYYNLGNLIGFAVGAAQAVLAGGAVARGPEATPLAQLGAYIAGSPAAAALSTAMVIFFLSGEVYFRAWRNPERPDLALVRRGDLLSALAASVLCVALVLLGNGALGLAATALLVGGKLGSAAMPAATWIVQPPLLPAFDPFRVAVAASRLPGILGVAAALVWSLGAGAAVLGDLVAQATLLVCFGLWLRADLMLFRAR